MQYCDEAQINSVDLIYYPASFLESLLVMIQSSTIQMSRQLRYQISAERSNLRFRKKK